jgi:hypothetical protein
MDTCNLVDLVKHAEQRVEPTMLTLERVPLGATHVPVLVHPQGLSVSSLKEHMDKYRLRPDRRAGTARAHDLESFIAHIKRHAGRDSVLFADVLADKPSLLAIYDYNEPGAEGVDGGLARWGQHRARYDFPLSEEWETWQEQDGKPMEQGEFAHFLEERLPDVTNPPTSWPDVPDDRAAGGDFGQRTPLEELAWLARNLRSEFAGPGRLLELSRGLSVTAEMKVTNAQVLQSGERSLVYSEEHKTADGQKLNVPGLFLIAIPIFRLGARYLIAVRLRYRLVGGKVLWIFEMHRADRALDHAVREACLTAEKETQVPLFYGAPEASGG